MLGVSTLLEALLASSSPDLLSNETFLISLKLGARSSAKMVVMVRFELTTFSMSKRRANQLRYTTIKTLVGDGGIEPPLIRLQRTAR